ncbi:MAG: hypothetical protein O3B95_08815 [Chloroflexi bacterium]|nr:hypothetical protein [Chloroflexota bacterium]
MTATVRSHNHTSDFELVSRLLIDTYRDPPVTRAGHVNWLQARWEYMHFHPLVWNVVLSSIGVWDDRDEIVAVAHPEHPASRYGYVEPVATDPDYRLR